MAVSNSCPTPAGRPWHAQRLRSLSLALFLVPLAAADDRHIGIIDFYGYSTLDLHRLRSLLPFHAGDPLPSKKSLTAAEPAYAKAIGRDRVALTTICRLPDGRLSLFVGLDEPGIAPVVFNPRPNGSAKLPANIVKLYHDSRTTMNLLVKSEEMSSPRVAISAISSAVCVFLGIFGIAAAQGPRLLGRPSWWLHPLS